MARGAFLIRENWRRPQGTEAVYTLVDPRELVRLAGAGTKRERNVELIKIVRDPEFNMRITADEIVTDRSVEGEVIGGELVNVRFEFMDGKGENERMIAAVVCDIASWVKGTSENDRHWELGGARLFVPSNLTSDDLELQESGEWREFCSNGELTRILKLGHAADPGSVLFIKFRRMAEPFNNVIMLLLGLPFLLSRERNIILSVGLVLVIELAFFAFIYISPYLIYDNFFSAFIPTLVVGPISILMLDSIRT
jgi:hypothetical protein